MLVRWLLTCIALWTLAVSTAFAALPWQEGPELLRAEQVFNLSPFTETDGEARARVRIPDGYYVYRHSLTLVDGGRGKLSLPPGFPKHDEFFGDTEIYTGDMLSLGIRDADGQSPKLRWQGCAEAGVCYPPQEVLLDLPVGALGAAAREMMLPVPAAEAPSAGSLSEVEADGGGLEGAGDDQLTARMLADSGVLTAIATFFGLGLLLAFTPCSLPMIPIVSTVVVGTQAKPARALVLSLSYILAMAISYAVVGVAAGLAGSNLQAALQSPWLLSAFAALFLLLAASLFGLFPLQIPATVAGKLNSLGGGQKGGSLWGAALLGVLSALLVGPCMTAPLAGALLYIGQSGSAVQGGLALFALGLGMGLPLLGIAVFGAHILPRPGAWMERVQIVFGYMMLAVAVLMLSRFLHPTASLALWAVWGFSLAAGLWVWARSSPLPGAAAVGLMTLALLSGAWSAVMVFGVAKGGVDPWHPLPERIEAAPAEPVLAVVTPKTDAQVAEAIVKASAAGKWTVIDFYADWCVSCHVMDREVFGDSQVASRLQGAVFLRPDVTANDGADQALLKEWGVLGPPTVILVGPDGRERRSLRTVGEVSASDFLQTLDGAGL